jgi:DNA invertase Pin-like site-specific DNA recombinase
MFTKYWALDCSKRAGRKIDPFCLFAKPSSTNLKPAQHMMKIGYARCSTDEQNLDLQIDALEKAGCDKIYKDRGVSAISSKRKGFENALSELESGDQLVVWKMDRAFRSLRHAMDVFDDFESRGIEFRELTEGIDTSTPMGKCFFQIRNAFSELERNLISERTKAGLVAAKKRGKTLGRPRSLKPNQVLEAKQLISRGAEVKALAGMLKVNESTLHRALKV